MTDHCIARAAREDAVIVAALAMQMDLERGAARRDGFLTEMADGWLADHDRRPTWLAFHPDGAASGLVLTSLTRKLPSLMRPTTCWMHVAMVYVRPQDRGQGIAEQMLRQMIAWGAENGAERFQLNAEEQARSLYERVGFGRPVDRLMELRLVDRHAERRAAPQG